MLKSSTFRGDFLCKENGKGICTTYKVQHGNLTIVAPQGVDCGKDFQMFRFLDWSYSKELDQFEITGTMTDGVFTVGQGRDILLCRLYQVRPGELAYEYGSLTPSARITCVFRFFLKWVFSQLGVNKWGKWLRISELGWDQHLTFISQSLSFPHFLPHYSNFILITI